MNEATHRYHEIWTALHNQGDGDVSTDLLGEACDLDDGQTAVDVIIDRAREIQAIKQGESTPEPEIDYKNLTDPQILELGRDEPKQQRLQEIHALAVKTGRPKDQQRFLIFEALLKKQKEEITRQSETHEPNEGEQQKIKELIEAGRAGARGDMESQRHFAKIQAELRAAGVKLPSNLSQQIASEG